MRRTRRSCVPTGARPTRSCPMGRVTRPRADCFGRRGAGDLSDEEWARLEPHLPRTMGRGGRWQCHRRVINGILFRQRTGVPWRDLPSRFGKWKTVHDRHRGCPRTARGRGSCGPSKPMPTPKAGSTGAWSAWTPPRAGPISTRQVLAHARHESPAGERTPVRHRPDEALGRSRGALTCKIHLAGEGGLHPLAFTITPGQWGDAPQLIPVLEQIRVPRTAGGRPRTRPDHLGGDKAYSSRRNPSLSAATSDQTHPSRAQGPAGQP